MSTITDSNVNKFENQPKRKRRQGNELIQYQKLAEGIYAINYKVKSSKLKYTKDQLMKILESNDEKKLREASNYFFSISGQYRNFISYYTNLFLYSYLVIPRADTKDAFKTNRFESDFRKVLSYIDNSYIEEVSRFITFTTIVDGVYYGYERQLGNIIMFQQLPPDYCRSLYKINGNYAVEFDFSFFDDYRDPELKLQVFQLFPPEFLQMYLDYKDGKSDKWVQLDPALARCHKFGDIGRPLLANLLPVLVDLQEYLDIDISQSKLDLYKLIVQKIPVDKNTGEPLIELEESRALHKNAKKMISQEGIDVLTTPLDVESINLQENGSTLKNNIERANEIVFNSAGISNMLFNSNQGGSIGLNNSIKVDESTLFPLLDQYKRWYDNKLRSINRNRNYWFEIFLPYITIFNRKEMFDLYKEAATLGYSKLMLLPTLGIKQTAFMDLIEYENNYLDITDKLIPLRSSYTQNSKGGRPQKDIDNLGEKGIEQRERDSNANRAK